MSWFRHVVGRGTLNQSLLSNQGLVFGTPPVRFRSGRKPNEKLAKPVDKSSVVLGKVKRIVSPTIHGVSDKQYPILMKWNKPQRIETCNPEISGDIGGLEHFGEVDLTQPPLELEGSRSLGEAEAVVQRLLSLEYCRNRDVVRRLRRDAVRGVQRHPLDTDSLEVQITSLTVKIRNYQRDLVQRFPYKNQPLKHDLTFKIALRRKLIEMLRQQDYRKYEWLLEKLNLFYKPVPHYDHNEISRKASIERLTDIWCAELKKHRLDRYRRALQDEQPRFLRAKAEKLAFIMQEEKELGLEQTVTQAEVDECLARAEEIEKRNAEEEKQPDNFLLYSEEQVKEQNIFIS